MLETWGGFQIIVTIIGPKTWPLSVILVSFWYLLPIFGQCIWDNIDNLQTKNDYFFPFPWLTTI